MGTLYAAVLLDDIFDIESPPLGHAAAGPLDGKAAIDAPGNAAHGGSALSPLRTPVFSILIFYS